MKLSQLKIDPEFQSKIPPLQFEEEQQLEQNIIVEGRLLNPIITWNGYILDGHTRYRILKSMALSSLKWKKSSLRTSTKRLHGSAKISLAAEISARNERSFFWARSMNRPSWQWAGSPEIAIKQIDVIKMITSIQKNALANESP